MSPHIAIGLFLSMVIHTSAFLLFSEHALQSRDALPEIKMFTVELLSFEAPLKKQTNQFISLDKTLGKDPSEKRRPENSDFLGTTNTVRQINTEGSNLVCRHPWPIYLGSHKIRSL